MNESKKTKIIGAILGILLFIVLIAGISYAWINWQSRNTEVSGNSDCFKINYTNGQTINNANVLLFDENSIINDNKITVKNGMAVTNVSASLENSCNIFGNIEIFMNVNSINNAFISGNSIGAFKYAIASYDPNLYEDITQTSIIGESFDIIKTDSITTSGEIDLINEALSKKEKGYLLIFYIDGDLAMNDAGNSSFSATITAVASQAG